MNDATESHAILLWDPKKGFELHLDVAGGEAVIRFVSMPVPADGTDALSAAPVGLHGLDLLFKAHVDWRGNPCQLTGATVQLTGDRVEMLQLVTTVEDPESGEARKLTLETTVDVPGGAPAAGGPVPQALEEDELDWDDETTMERMFGDLPAGMAPPGAGRDDDEPEGEDPRQVAGLAALFKALSLPEMDERTGEVPIGTTGPPPTVTKLVDAPAPESVPPRPEPPPPPPPPEPMAAMGGGATFTIEEEARSFLKLLVDHEHLELIAGETIDSLIGGMAPILASRRGPEAKAKQVSDWILSQDSVEELYIDDESLANLLEQW